MRHHLFRQCRQTDCASFAISVVNGCIVRFVLFVNDCRALEFVGRHDRVCVGSNTVGHLLVQLLKMVVHCTQVEQREQAQNEKEGVSEVELGVAVEHSKERERLNENENGADVGGQGVVLEVDSHLFDALGVPLQLAELVDVLVVHLGWEED